jgi:hypothetical protein
MADDESWVWTVRVSWTSSRPVRPDEHVSFVRIAARDETDAVLLAAQMVGSRGNPDGGPPFASGRPRAVMVTRTEILSAEW